MNYINKLETIFENMEEKYLLFSKYVLVGGYKSPSTFRKRKDVNAVLDILKQTNAQNTITNLGKHFPIKIMSTGNSSTLEQLQELAFNTENKNDGTIGFYFDITDKKEEIEWNPESDQLLDDGDEWGKSENDLLIIKAYSEEGVQKMLLRNKNALSNMGPRYPDEQEKIKFEIDYVRKYL